MRKCISEYTLKQTIFKGCLPQISLGPSLNTLPHIVLTRQNVFHNRDLTFKNEETSGQFFSMKLHHPDKGCQNGFLRAYVKLVNKVLHVLSWKKVIFAWKTWLQQQKSYLWNYSYIANMDKQLKQDLHKSFFNDVWNSCDEIISFFQR